MSISPVSSKIINDPIYGLIQMPKGIGYEIINHRWFQRLRRIKQLGLTNMVYPGAEHTRFGHTLGCVYLMQSALEVLCSKEVKIEPEEAEGAVLAILLHDIGHCPFSHALENKIVTKMSHEEISLLIANELNKTYNSSLDIAIEIIKDKYHKKFLHQLVSSQLDVDRLDYLKRDSFYTGVSEGVISTDRIIKTLNVVNDQLVVDHKGIYSIEKFLIARRLMYWQVYLHKTVISVQQMIKNIILYAKYLSENGEKLAATPAMTYFLSSVDSLNASDIEIFVQLDDNDIISTIKNWTNNSTPVLKILCNKFFERNLSKMQLSNQKFDDNIIFDLRKKVAKKFNISVDDAKYLVYSDTLSNNTYTPTEEDILILLKTGEVQTIIEASDMFKHEVMSKTVLKHYLCYPKELDFLH